MVLRTDKHGCIDCREDKPAEGRWTPQESLRDSLSQAFHRLREQMTAAETEAQSALGQAAHAAETQWERSGRLEAQLEEAHRALAEGRELLAAACRERDEALRRESDLLSEVSALRADVEALRRGRGEALSLLVEAREEESDV